MSISSLAESIILQSMEDVLADGEHSEESLKFLTGEGFDSCASLAGIGIEERLKVLSLLKDTVSKQTRRRARDAYCRAARAKHLGYGATEKVLA